MAYDLLIKNGRIVDGSGMPAFRGDVGVKDGKIAEIGKLERPGRHAPSMPTAAPSRPASSTTTAITTRRSPGTRCARSRRSTAPPPSSSAIARWRWRRCGRATEERMAEFLSYVEAIPMEVLNTVDVDWETIPQYMDQLDKTSRRQCRQPDRPHARCAIT